MKNFYPFYVLILALLFESNSTGQTVTDADGNVYHTVVIGTQEWTVENLHTTQLNDGTSISIVTDNNAWPNLTTPGYCYYGNLIENDTAYGILYNWRTVNTNKLCPTGWAVPTDSEWTTLVDYLGGSSVAGDKLKEVGTAHWVMNPNGTNESGFTALPGGQRGAYGVFDLLRLCGSFWSSTEVSSTNASIWSLYYHSGLVQSFGEGKDAGKSVRCLKGGISGLDNKTKSSFNIKIFPNPSNRAVKIESSQSQKAQLWITDIFGKIVLEKHYTGSTEIEITTKGIYILKIADGSGIKVEKLIIE
jgi:uncharacterized protein (TIGR02145 family)